MTEWIETYLPNVYRIGWEGTNSWPDAIYATLYMTSISFVVGGLLGLIIGLFLILTGPNGVIENNVACEIIDKITSVLRAMLFINLLAIIAPVTYCIVGESLGMTATLIQLTAAHIAL